MSGFCGKWKPNKFTSWFGEKKSHSLRIMLECDLVTLKNNHTTWKTIYNNKLLKAEEKENNSQKHPERNKTFLTGKSLFGSQQISPQKPLRPEGNGTTFFKCWKKNTVHYRFYFWGSYPLGNKEKSRVWDEEKWKEHVVSRYILKDWLNDVFQIARIWVIGEGVLEHWAKSSSNGESRHVGTHCGHLYNSLVMTGTKIITPPEI